jgi:glyoxylase-like metal-dependent hydrolase (beta-lactamase superfamily II)
MTIDLGEIRIDRINELDSWPFPAAELFPGLREDGPPTVDLTITTHLVRAPGLTMLVDTGNGNGKERPVLRAHDGFATDYLDRLAATGVCPEDVDVVVTTHLHPDHCGGQTRRGDNGWMPTFPNARHLVARAEYDWMAALHAARPETGAESDLARTFADSVLPVADAGLLELVDVPYRLVGGITLHPLPGHTAGHLIVEVDGGGHTAVIIGDVVHHPLQFADLTLAQAGDADPAAAARSRLELCERAAATGALLLPAHFGGPGGGHVQRDASGFRFVCQSRRVSDVVSVTSCQ